MLSMTMTTSGEQFASEQTKTSPLVAIVGRPNVGKSTLFNRLIGERRSIVGDEPGITRDRIYGEVDWAGVTFSLIDTGGIVPDDDALIPANILKQAGVAIEQAHVLVWVVDARKGITQLDEELANLLRATGKRVLVAANKVDSASLENERTEFYRFGFHDSDAGRSNYFRSNTHTARYRRYHFDDRYGGRLQRADLRTHT